MCYMLYAVCGAMWYRMLIIIISQSWKKSQSKCWEKKNELNWWTDNDDEFFVDITWLSEQLQKWKSLKKIYVYSNQLNQLAVKERK